MAWFRLTFRLTAFGLFLAATVMLAATLLIADFLTRKQIDRTPWARACFRWACRCLGLDIHVHGAPPEHNVLYASNHISWSDIPILGSLTPIRFLSKAEVGQWPVIGWLAQQAGTLFIKRGGGQARRIRKDISEKLKGGESVLVFPEGTTSAGLTVLPFHGLLLGAAADSGLPVQPITISYRRNGCPDHLSPFIRNDEFHTHLIAMLKQPPARIDVLFHPPLPVTSATRTGELAGQLQTIVTEGLARIHGQEFDQPDVPPIRTAAAPELPHPR
ncbi:1-acyl-sn-glycerol-3-phosphate acyltransferase [Marinobacter salinus]|uniref:1-acyl-sn-glycerol-3-phosphate acyltransferase n=1 Tax=Marinobacter salinus TaxID=1874317 RepID=A0A1D9GLN8_9GAMM|nr:lysophospholipid acyltransferase family protein [Marinobacter salinus]AOY88557.1 1-acyl-sn-glycerol-3-phosphate acyltransferase [Marinobacter salinus]